MGYSIAGDGVYVTRFVIPPEERGLYVIEVRADLDPIWGVIGVFDPQ